MCSISVPTISVTYSHYIEKNCDSIVYLDLTLNSNYFPTSQSAVLNINTCTSWTSPYGVTYTETPASNPVYVVIGQTSGGCDSLQFYNINIAAEKYSDVFRTACDTFT